MIRHIEFLGLPASGKTTLTSALAHALAASDQRTPAPSASMNAGETWQRQFRDLMIVLGFLIRNPRWCSRMWHACAAFRQPSAGMQVRMFLSCLRLEQAARRRLVAGADDHFVIVDQGVYQAIWSLALCAPADLLDSLSGVAAPILRLFEAPDLVVLVDTPTEVVRERLSTGPDGHGRLPSLIERDPLWLSKAERCLAAVWRLARESRSPHTFKLISADGDLRDLVSLVASSE